MTERSPVPASLSCDMIIPALNERPGIDPLFDALEPLRSRLRHVVLADNGSTDGTAEAAESRGAVVVREPRRGYGAACLAALRWMEEAGPPAVVAFLDADLADDPSMLSELLAPIERGDAELVIGSRIARATPGALNAVQRSGNGLACVMMSWLGGRRYTDLGPFRIVTWSALRSMGMADRTWGWTVEMQMKAALLDIPSVEVDVPYHRRPHGRSKISGTLTGVMRAGSKIIYTILALWLRRRHIRRDGST